MKITKRNGKVTDFDTTRIHSAVMLAGNDAGRSEEDSAILASKVVIGVIKFSKAHKGKTTSIYAIQTLVENLLMKYDKDVARHYIEYRHERDKARLAKSELISEIAGLVDGSNKAVLDENANKDSGILPTQRDLLAGVVSKYYARKFILPKHVVQGHDEGLIHYHDLDYAPFFPITNCCLVDLPGMLKHGFRMGNAQIESPKSIATAAAITAQVIAQVASNQYGGTTIGDIDVALEPYVRLSHAKHLKTGAKWIADPIKVRAYAKERTAKEVYDAMQGLEYEVNTLHTSNGQTPFVTFGFGMSTSEEGRLIQDAILRNRIKGLGKSGNTPVFPKLVFAVKDGINRNKGDVNYDIKQLAVKCAALRMYPDVLNVERNMEVTGADKVTYPMGCRSFLSRWEDENGEVITNGRNNLGVVSLNLPRIALEVHSFENRQEAFFSLLEERLTLAKQALMTRIERLENTPASVAPILYTEGALGHRLKPTDKIIEIFKNGRASISLGYIGLHELAEIMFDDADVINNGKAKAFLVDVLQKMKDAVGEWKEDTGYGFSLYSTPSESLCDRFARIDAEIYGKEFPNIFEKGYYTNSFHLDVRKKVNPYEKLDFEHLYPYIATGGHICYTEYPNMLKNLKGLEDVWDYAAQRVPYYGTNTPVDKCYDCGYAGEFKCTSKGFECPKCGNHDSTKMNVIRRVCGYLGNPDARAFNNGKQSEVIRRVKHLPSQTGQI